jgi:hypothetical protein
LKASVCRRSAWWKADGPAHDQALSPIDPILDFGTRPDTVIAPTQGGNHHESGHASRHTERPS